MLAKFHRDHVRRRPVTPEQPVQSAVHQVPAQAVHGIHIAENFCLERAGLFLLVEGDAELLQTFDDGAAQNELHVPQRAAHEADKRGVEQGILGQQQKVAAGNPENSSEGIFSQRRQRVHDHPHRQWKE